MPISLAKGQKVDLTKTNPGLTEVLVGLGWDTQKYDGQADFDLDGSAFVLGGNGQVRNESDFVFYNNPNGANGSIVHSGDNRTGDATGDDEVININLSQIPSDVEKIAFTATIHEGEERRQNFGQVSNAYIRVVNKTTGEELIRYDLGEDFSIETAVVIGELYRHNNEWKFSAIGSGFSGGLGALAQNFGLQVA